MSTHGIVLVFSVWTKFLACLFTFSSFVLHSFICREYIQKGIVFCQQSWLEPNPRRCNVGKCIAHLPITTSPSNHSEVECFMIGGIGRLPSYWVVCPIVDNDVLEVSQVALTHGCHGTHVHDHRAVTVQAEHLQHTAKIVLNIHM